jgi:hypothetical protein
MPKGNHFAKGRPRKKHPSIQIGCRIDLDIYEAIKEMYGAKVNMTKFINDVLRKELELYDDDTF